MWIGVLVIVTVALGMRMAAAHGDLWVDEIWSLDIARQATTPSGILGRTVDNNHLLNTFFLYAVRDQASFWVFRIHSVLAGAVSVALAGLLLRRWAGNAAAVFAMLLMTFSYVMINYGSEARGYAMQVMFLLAALLALDHGLNKRSWGWASVFWFCCALGFLSHALFLHGYAAMLAWSAWRVWKADAPLKLRIAAMIMFHAVPLAFAATLYFTFIRHMEIAGASVSSLWATIGGTAAFTLGLPRGDGWSAAALGIAGAIVVSGTVMLVRARRDSWVFFITACVIAPVLIAWVSSTGFLLPRYFLIPMACLLLLLAIVLGEVWRMGLNGRAVATLLMTGFVAANALDTRRLLIDGRGHYLDALRFIVAYSPQDEIRVTGDHDVRQQTIVDFYKPYLQSDHAIRYIRHDQAASFPPQWMLVHRWEGEAAPPEVFTVQFGQPMAFEQRAAFEASPLGGWRNYVYERISQ